MNNFFKRTWYPISQSTYLTSSGMNIITYLGNAKVRVHSIEYQPTKKELKELKQEGIEYAKQRRNLL